MDLPNVPNIPLVVRRREIASAILTELGGAENLSETRKQLVWRFAAAAVLAEQLEAQLARGQHVDIKAYAHLTSTLVRIAQCIGIDQQAKDTSPNLRDYLLKKTPETKAAE